MSGGRKEKVAGQGLVSCDESVQATLLVLAGKQIFNRVGGKVWGVGEGSWRDSFTAE